MKTKSIKSYVAVAIITIVGLGSCQKENIQPVISKHEEPTSASVQAIASDQTYMNGLTYKSLMIAFGAMSGNINAFKNENSDNLLGGCATVTKDTTVFPNQLTVEFGNGCTLNDGSPVTGVITGTYTSSQFGSVPGSQAVLNFDSFYINGNHILGVITLQNKGTNANSNMTFDVSMTNGNLIFGSDGRMIKQNVQWLFELITSGTNVISDDQFSITGTANGVTSNGDAYTDSIVSPLVISRDPNCVREFIKGVTLAHIANNPDLQIDYGSGTCDTRADATQGGVTVRISLKDY